MILLGVASLGSSLGHIWVWVGCDLGHRRDHWYKASRSRQRNKLLSNSGSRRYSSSACLWAGLVMDLLALREELNLGALDAGAVVRVVEDHGGASKAQGLGMPEPLWMNPEEFKMHHPVPMLIATKSW